VHRRAAALSSARRRATGPAFAAPPRTPAPPRAELSQPQHTCTLDLPLAGKRHECTSARVMHTSVYVSVMT
jgi:hypothetical protein